MPLYEVRRRTVLASSMVEADSEMEARIKARDVWQQDAAMASLSADVVYITEPDDTGDERSELRYEETPADLDSDQVHAERWTP